MVILAYTVKKSPKKLPVKKSPPKKSPMVKRKSVKKSPVKNPLPKKSPAKKSPMVKKLSPRLIRKERKSPPYHANEFRVGTKMQGIDGNMWKIITITKADGSKYKRWSRV
jgi:hypothetical protein